MNPVRVAYRGGLGCLPPSPPRVAYGGGARARSGLGALTTAGAASGVKTGATAASLSTSIGASIGTFAGVGTSFAPVIGTAIGVIVGLIASGVFNHRVDPEVGNFNNAAALYNSQGPNAIFNIADKYLVLAGLFDLEPGQIKGNIPMVKKYGRMGEQHFTQDMANLIYQAAQAGRITENDTPQSVFNNIVQPWLSSFGYGAMQDANGDMLNAILLGMVAEYVTGLWKTRWFARSGDMPNWQIPVFALPASAAPSAPVTPAAAAPAPMPAPVAAAAPAPMAVPPGFLSTYTPFYAGGPAPAASPVGLPIPSGAPNVQLPPGYSQTSYTSYETGAPLYLGQDGRIYAISAGALALYTGTMYTPASPGTAANLQHVTNGTLDSAQVGPVLTVSQLPTTALPTSSLPPALYSGGGPVTPSIIDQSMQPEQQPVSQPVATAGISSNLGLWVGGLTVLALLLSTARPVGQPAKVSS